MRRETEPSVRSWPSWLRICVLGCWVVLGGSTAFGAQPRRVGGPVSVAVAYIAALDRHDGAAVCRLFSPQLRSFEIQRDAPRPGRFSCAQTVGGHFRNYYSRHRWASARIRGPMHLMINARTSIAAVRMTLVHRYVCASQVVPPEPCHPSYYVRPDIIYLIRIGARWRLIKPGSVYHATGIDHPFYAESDYYPPGDPTTIAGPVNLPTRSAPCPSSKAISVSPPHNLQSEYLPNPMGGPGDEPWLMIDSLAVARLSKIRVCFTLTLAGPPHPDSAYDIFVGSIQQQAAADLFDVEIDGLGNPYPLLEGQGALSNPRLAPVLPRVFLAGDQLEIIGTDRMLAKLPSFLVVASSQSIQSDEPLLKSPLDAGDAAPLRGCLTFPTGKLDTHGLCGSTPSP